MQVKTSEKDVLQGVDHREDGGGEDNKETETFAVHLIDEKPAYDAEGKYGGQIEE